jgi:hypothetical protein
MASSAACPRFEPVLVGTGRFSVSHPIFGHRTATKKPPPARVSKAAFIILIQKTNLVAGQDLNLRPSDMSLTSYRATGTADRNFHRLDKGLRGGGVRFVKERTLLD